MEKHKFKIGDRVRVIKIDNPYYSKALYKVGDVGTIRHCYRLDKYDTNDYCITFDRLKAIGEDPIWWALEPWLVRENPIMVFE